VNPNIRYVRATAATPVSFRIGFVSAYQEAFGGAPYFERYTQAEVVADIWWPHLSQGLVVLALLGERVIGFGCTMPLVVAPSDVQGFLERYRRRGEFPPDSRRTWYLSEMGVRTPYRQQGIGYGLVREQFRIINQFGGSTYVLRTAAIGSNSVHLFRRIGAAELDATQDVSGSDQVQVNRSQSTKRLYLYGSCAQALQALPL
jgi:hypothetical protein